MFKHLFPKQLVTLCFMVLVFQSPALLRATCPAGVAAVEVGLISGAEADDTFRREHAHISSALADDLGITTVEADGENTPQIRVVIDSPTIDGLTSTANFSVTAIFTDNDKVLRVHGKESTGDKDSGFFKLFVNNDSLDLTTVSATVYSVAPSLTTIVDGVTTTQTQSFCEPTGNGNRYFKEYVTVEADDRFALFAPHGGLIEAGTSEEIGTIVGILSDDYSVPTNVWENVGKWGNNQTFQRWHVTSDAIRLDAFPGLDYLIDHSAFDATRNFQYVVTLHGFSWTRLGIVVGGRTSREAKCLVVTKILERLADEEVTDQIAFYVVDVAGSDISLPDADGVYIESQKNVNDMRGTAAENVVNRFSPNATGAFGFGGIQLEQSRALRDNAQLRTWVAEGVANALGELITAPATTPAYCAALE